MLRFDQVFFYYQKRQPVIDHISFSIEEGEFVAIVGANGCGKSTLAQLMDGLLLPRGGRVTYRGLDTANPAELAMIREQIGFVFQNPENQFITASVLDEIIFGLENIRVPREEMRARADQALRAVRMEGYEDAAPHQLSGGQKQKVAIAAVLAMRPRIIIFDEATSMLDPQGRKEMLSIMHELHRQGMTIIHITHHMEEALSALRLLLIHQGRLEYDGDPAAFFDTMAVADYELELPFAVRLHRTLAPQAQLSADWKEMLRSQWSMN
ncbi:energy-coupling factor transporter ATPase [Paenibacillus aceti]|uniref:Energy-coupling factor transporter ATP-binding protein EcfA1 n=1 Tax=Paenibacillus aceti TaxID=1820010 RepID=A0ABQ1W373_9BACL|nr:energy-coupling factor transporter ATPase [Paenibacillus aceti]GGG12740.1 energy-coupling factor transporter ATP-binding protein EcfA1 [Paenibacillus aceti]